MVGFYIISPETKAMIKVDSPYYRTKIVEGRTEKLSVQWPEQIIDNSCLIHGADLKGRRKSAQIILESAFKLPIPIAPSFSIFMFPTASVKSKDCVWLAFHHIKFFEQRGNQTYIGFYDNTGIYVNASEKTIDTQYKRTSQLIVHFNRRTLFGYSKNIW